MPESSATVGPMVAGSSAEAVVERDDDLEAVSRVQAGDVAAFDELVFKYRERLYAVVYNLVSNREDANDITQDAFIKAFRSIHKFKGRSAFFTWLYRIGVNTAITHLKRHRMRHFFSFDNLDAEVAQSELVEILASRSTSDKSTLLRELQEKLNEALQKLSLKHRTVVVLHEIEGLSHQEIAEITGTSEGTVRSRLHYAKQQLQASLQPYLN